MNRDSDIKVSVCINTYNQERYIDKTLSSVLDQKANFKYEVIVHDDASTDETQSIVSRYADKYPGVVRCILQSENQFKVNAHKPFRICWDSAKGDYVALCEGDDYWVDEYKLQKQYDLIRETGANICFTNAYKENPDGTRMPFFSKKYKNSDIVALGDIIRRGGGAMPTASIMVSRAIIQNLPDWFDHAPVGDFFIQVLGSIRCGAAYLRDSTVVYRVFSGGAWSDSRSNYSEEYIRNLAHRYVSTFSRMTLREIDPLDLNFAISQELFHLAVISYKNGYKKLASELVKQSWMYYKAISFKQFLMYLLSPVLK
ncbi:MAG: glycosyltransferase [Thalassolituus oleivorans]|uniref:glycosyltransferase family 2 protein n=1 Tax=Thalassolituus oleivorans TaxID=187493 RepID=UPI001B3E40C8|nr:glycosyltransferase [Thalassolituus oleivorans]MBQ0725764.1 glycosyltransferase [Thalassolituus oleivorans]